MLTSLKLWNFSSGTLQDEELKNDSFVLRTCQRTLVLAYDRNPFHHQDTLQKHDLVTGQDAYLFLLETICGLKSKLIGENEIVGQFKDAYKIYASSTLKDTKLLLILEKLFKDAKDIRTQYLIGISQKTYASLTRRHFQKAHADHIVVVGSGALAEDLINQFKKKAQVTICARNTEKANELAKTHSLNVIPWEERHRLVDFPFIANTVGADTILFDETFFNEWKRPTSLFVDLGSPSTIKTSLTLNEGVVRLEDIFNEGAVVEEQKRAQIGLARDAMVNVSFRRMDLFAQKIRKTPELISPQITSDVRYI